MSNTLTTSKYYTPSIEEFHVGFEYEEGDGFVPPIEWTKEKLGKTVSGDLEDLDDSIREGQIRVKQLDQEDIESFGFTRIAKDEYSKGSYVFYIYKNNLCDLAVSGDYDGEYPHFRGQIKNKSELKKVLDMLGILK